MNEIRRGCRGSCAVNFALPYHSPAPVQLSRTVCKDSCSASWHFAQRSQASHSICSWISNSTRSRRSLGSIASNSQQRAPYLSTNQLQRLSFFLSDAGNDVRPKSRLVSAIRFRTTCCPPSFQVGSAGRPLTYTCRWGHSRRNKERSAACYYPDTRRRSRLRY